MWRQSQAARQKDDPGDGKSIDANLMTSSRDIIYHLHCTGLYLRIYLRTRRPLNRKEKRRAKPSAGAMGGHS